MAHTYYSRLTQIHPRDVTSLDPRRGIVIAETATTGRFILSDITWKGAVAPNYNTTVANHVEGEMKIQEPLGMYLFDYLRAAAYQLDIENYLDARYFLEIEILAEDFLKDKKQDSPFKYVFPIMLISTELNSVNEKGTEYDFKFVHESNHAQTDMVQPIKETITIEGVEYLSDYFTGLQKALESREFSYALARQKAGSSKNPGGKNPAASDPYHDEYHFILQPRMSKYTFNTKKQADPAIQGAWTNIFPWTQNQWNIQVRPGTTLISQINKVLMSTKEIADLLPGRPGTQTKDASGSSELSSKNNKNMLGTVYQFFRIETHSVYKSYDYIRGRYAVKHVFFIFLADQPNMYQYPDEIDQLYRLSNKAQAEKKLRYYITEGLLQKIYYYYYTGLNTDIIKVNLQLNQAFFLPSFPVVWGERGQTGPGPMNKYNYDEKINPFNHLNPGVRSAIRQIQGAAVQLNAQLKEMINEKGELKENTAENRKTYNELQRYITFYENEIAKREAELAASKQDATNQNQIKNREDLLKSLKSKYIEDIDIRAAIQEQMYAEFPSLKARMEPDASTDYVDIIKSENERLVEKLFTVLTSRDLLELEIEIIGDPFWLGVPNVLLQGNSGLKNIEFTSKHKDELTGILNAEMPKIDPNWSTKDPVWHDYGVAQWYKGAPLFYFATQMPDSEFTEDDLLKFFPNDQIAGIYTVIMVTNEFKQGRWTQKLISKRDTTIPTFIIPQGTNGQLAFEEYMDQVLGQTSDSEQTANAQAANEQRSDQLQSNNFSGARGSAIQSAATNALSSPNTTTTNTPSSLPQSIVDAKQVQRNLIEKNPPPTVNDPVGRANELVAGGMTRQEAYNTAKKEYITQINAYNTHMEGINKQAYEQAGVKDYKPYSADTMNAMSLSRSRAGGLEDWKNNETVAGPAANNNPAAIGYDSSNRNYYKYDSFTQGLNAANEYFNFGNQVKALGKQGQERLLLPSSTPQQELNYLTNKLSNKGGG